MTTIAQHVGRVAANLELTGRANEFVQAAKFIMAARRGEDLVYLAERAKAPARVVEFLKAATDPGTISGWGSPLAVRNLASAFLASLGSTSAFDAMLPSMLQAPLRSSIVSVSATLSGGKIAEQSVKPVSKLTLAGSDLDPDKVAALIAISAEVIKSSDPLATALLKRELSTALSRATNAWFLPLLVAGASFASSGATALAVAQDLRTLLANVTTGSDSKLFLIVPRLIAEAWAVVSDSSGGPAFPTATVNGGSIGGIQIIVVDEATSTEIIMVDASQVAAGTDGSVVLDTSTETSIQFDSAPDSPPTASTNIVSLYQSDLVALKAERWLGAKVLRSDAVAKITSANYTGNSPA